jgi:putative ABC transport system permease protein
MLRNYLTVALRNLARHKLYSAINIGGLAVGLAACLLILLFVRDEVSYERWNPKADRIANFEITFRVPGREVLTAATSPGPLAPALIKDFSSDIERAVRVLRDDVPVRIGDRQFSARPSYVDPGFFELFDLPMIAGERDAVLANNASVILSQTTARKYFGAEPAIGKTITVNTKDVFTVIGVFADLPAATHLELESIALFDVARYKDNPWVAESWTGANVHTYVLFRSAEARARVAAAIPAFLDRNVSFEIAGFNEPPSTLMSLTARPLLDVHLHGSASGYRNPGSFAAVVGFAGIALLILIIACINFVNLATARAMQRAREVAVRKVVGATRGQLVRQYLGEALVTALIALVIAIAVVELALGPFNRFLGKDLRLDLLGDPALLAIALGLVVVVGVVGGLYPAIYLSRFRPAAVLKANQSSAQGTSRLRTGLVVFQFAISIALIVCTVTVYGQTVYARTLELGFERGGRIALEGLYDMPSTETAKTLKQEVAALPGVKGASLSSDTPPLHNMNNTLFFPSPAAAPEAKMLIEVIRIDPDFFAVYGVTPVAGRVFDAARADDYQVAQEGEPPPGEPRQSVVINEAFARMLAAGGRVQDVVGRELWEVNQEDRPLIRTTVIGIVPDLHLRSARIAITPMAYFANWPLARFNRLTVHVAAGQIDATMREIRAVWSRLAPEVPLRSAFVADELESLYDADEQRGQIFAGFAVFAVLIACMGLFGLASFSAERRTKEIGMRKVLGASVLDIVRLLVWQFSRPVLVANLIAWPIAFYAMHRWLAGFRYAIDLTSPVYLVAIFGGAAVLALAIAWITTAGHAYRVARASPGRALRVE